MAHARDQIVDGLITAVQGVALFAGAVYESRRVAIASAVVPAASIEWTDEESREMTFTNDPSADMREIRDLTVEVEVYTDTLADRDTAALDVEKAVYAAAQVGRARRYLGGETESSDEGGRPFYSTRLRFGVQYHVDRSDPETIITAG